MAGGLDGRGRQRTAKIGLMNADDAQAGCLSVVAEPPERQLVPHGQDDERVRGGMPKTGQVRVRNGEVECRVCRLTGLRSWCQIGAGDQE